MRRTKRAGRTHLKKTALPYPVVVHESGYGYDVHCPVLPGCHSQGETLKATLDNIRDAIRIYLEMVRAETRSQKVYSVNVAV